jgi:hypothetical protein
VCADLLLNINPDYRIVVVQIVQYTEYRRKFTVQPRAKTSWVLIVNSVHVLKCADFENANKYRLITIMGNTGIILVVRFKQFLVLLLMSTTVRRVQSDTHTINEW